MQNTKFIAPGLVLTLAACGASGSGDVSIFVEAEDTITDGLTPGTEEENIVDGWTVSYDQFVVAIGHVHLSQQATGLAESVEDITVLDLASLPATGFPLASFEGLSTGVWDVVEFETPVATATATRDPSVSQADFDAMVAGGCTYLIAGTITATDGESCVPGASCMPNPSIDFRFCIPAATDFGPCSTPDGLPGLTVNNGLTTSSAITIHGDHMFFSGFPVGDEAVVERRAQWLANCDTNVDGTVTQAELQGATAATIFTAPDYSLAGAPGTVTTAWDYLIAQVKTQGHWNGEGECPVDGVGHEH